MRPYDPSTERKHRFHASIALGEGLSVRVSPAAEIEHAHPKNKSKCFTVHEVLSHALTQDDPIRTPLVYHKLLSNLGQIIQMALLYINILTNKETKSIIQPVSIQLSRAKITKPSSSLAISCLNLSIWLHSAVIFFFVSSLRCSVLWITSVNLVCSWFSGLRQSRKLECLLKLKPLFPRLQSNLTLLHGCLHLTKISFELARLSVSSGGFGRDRLFKHHMSDHLCADHDR